MQAVGHGIEGLAQLGDVVLTVGAHALIETPGGEALGNEGSTTYRIDHESGDHKRDGAQEQHERDTTKGEGPRNNTERLLLALEGEDEIQLVLSCHRQVHT